MPLEYTVYEAIGLVRASARDPYTLRDFLDYLQTVVCDYRFRPGFRELIDLRQVTSCKLEYRELERIIRDRKTLLEKRGSGAVAFLVASPEMYGVGRTCQILAEHLPFKIGVFWQEEEAVQFLANPDQSAMADGAEFALFPMFDN